MDRADIGVFGGSGFYSLLHGAVEQVTVQTPYGPPSDTIAIGHLGDIRVAFLPRHGAGTASRLTRSTIAPTCGRWPSSESPA